ncbi:hypothetical protein VTJ04DRAFT_6052 [Mycothermus thermophilus]|uniref:uncharacterized protein n=1 Tax=Humicola insolens TaxID=85995 RepID=UPI0037444424
MGITLPGAEAPPPTTTTTTTTTSAIEDDDSASVASDESEESLVTILDASQSNQDEGTRDGEEGKGAEEKREQEGEEREEDDGLGALVATSIWSMEEEVDVSMDSYMDCEEEPVLASSPLTLFGEDAMDIDTDDVLPPPLPSFVCVPPSSAMSLATEFRFLLEPPSPSLSPLLAYREPAPEPTTTTPVIRKGKNIFLAGGGEKDELVRAMGRLTISTTPEMTRNLQNALDEVLGRSVGQLAEAMKRLTLEDEGEDEIL